MDFFNNKKLGGVKKLKQAPEDTTNAQETNCNSEMKRLVSKDGVLTDTDEFDL